MPGALTYSPANIVKQLLVDKGLGVEPSSAMPAWSVFFAGEPDKPDSCITVYDTVGRQQGKTMPDGETQEFHGIQIRVRAARHSAGWTKARAIAQAMDEDVYFETVAIGAEQYEVQTIHRTSDVLSIGKQDASRSVFTINLLVMVLEL